MKKIINMRQDGFTLIEILMAVLVIVILAVVGITQFSNFAADAKNAATKSNLAILRNAIGTMNALERVRCAKVDVGFPDPGTIQNNDITGCTGAVATAACYPLTLMDPRGGAGKTYGAMAHGGVAAGATCTLSITAPTDYTDLIPVIDRPYVQGGIPKNPWSGPLATQLANTVTADTAPATGAISCLNAPVNTVGSLAIATECVSVQTVFGTAPTTDSGWCYCQMTGQIWANTANNDGRAGATGTESNF